MPKRKLLLAGYGYVAKYLDKNLDKNNWDIIGTSRTPKDDLIFYEHGKNKINISDITHILISIPPQNNGDPFFKDHTVDDFPNIQWVGYLSSTGVYGNYNGDWVNEESTLLTNDAIGIARKNAELAWINSKFPTNIIRLGGIYGPNRNTVQRVINGHTECLAKKGLIFNRIHIDDIVAMLLALITNPQHHNKIYNCVDDLPSSQEEVMKYIGQILDIPITSKQYNSNDNNISPYLKHFYENNKKVDNSKMKLDLNLELKYPTYLTGLDSFINSAYIAKNK